MTYKKVRTLRKRWDSGDKWRVEFAHPNLYQERADLIRQYPNHEIEGDVHSYFEFYSIEYSEY